MPNSAYWKKRMEALEDANYQKGRAYMAHVDKQFRIAQQNMERQIEYWYARIADNNGLTMQGAKRLLRADELEDFKLSVEDYIKKGESLNYSDKWAQQLENASAKVHISRLEALKMQMQQECEVLYGNMADGLDDTLRSMYTSSYYNTAYEFMRGVGVGWAFNQLDTRRIERAINTVWATDGLRFSDRVWKNKEKLMQELNTVLVQNIIQGESPQKAIAQLSKRMNVSRSRAGTLIMTESAFIHSQSQRDCYHDLDVERYQFVATLDSKTSEVCQAMDGVIIDMKDYTIGVNVPPLHPNCRSCTIPYYEDNVGVRIARGADGKTYEVPGNMTYKEWKKAFVDGDVTDLKPAKNDDTMELRNKIANTDIEITDLKRQFSDATEGYSYDDWFKEFDSIEDGFGNVSDNDESFIKLKELDQKIKITTKKKAELLHQKEKRKQLDTGYDGEVPDNKRDAFNAKALEQIKLDTGYSDEKATEFQKALQEYFGGDYEAILSGKTRTAMVICDGLDRMPIYDGSISRGMIFDNSDVKVFSDLKIGDELPRKGMIESWSSQKGTAIAYSGISDYDRSSVLLECENNKTAVGVQHLSSFGKAESEVLSSSKYEVVEVITENKYDYLSRHKEYLYFDSDLEEAADTMKENIVCIIKVKEKK